MSTALVTTIIEAVGRISLAIAVAFICWVVLGQQPTCPACGNPIDKPVTYTQAKLLGEK